ncbi:hypothetical protein ACFWPK_03170 [Nocardia sp. NPDC058519]|uniref:hypothetical protein n=1 Tax=Nocardia sp. NPDC058519 TaxID=3346535 RepID=UPI003668F172
MSTARLFAVWRLVRVPTILVAVYFSLRWVLAILSARQGFGSPDGIGLGFSIVATVTVSLRIVLLVMVPAVPAYHLVLWVTARMSRRDGSRAPAAHRTTRAS